MELDQRGLDGKLRARERTDFRPVQLLISLLSRERRLRQRFISDISKFHAALALAREYRCRSDVRGRKDENEFFAPCVRVIIKNGFSALLEFGRVDAFFFSSHSSTMF